MSNTKTKITFVMPDPLQQEFRERVVKDGYDLRGKSRWVAESVERLLTMGNYPELVHLSNQMKGFEKLESVLIPKELKGIMDQAIVSVRQIYPMLEGVQSSLLRTAIIQRLLHS